MTHPSTSPMVRRIQREERRALVTRWAIVLLCGLAAGAVLVLLVML